MSLKTRLGLHLPWDWWLFFAGLLLCLIGLVAMRSAAETLNRSLFIKQATWFLIGIAISWVVASVPYPRWIDVGVMLFPVAVVALVVVMIAGTVKLGAARWITVFGFSLQPSELAKLTSACWLARYLSGHSYPVPTKGLVMSALIIGVPAGLIFIQPDLGTSSIFGAMWLGCVWLAGISPRSLATLTGGFAALLPIGWHFLKDYQRARLTAFIDPHADPLGAGYTIIQSRIAIGSGRLLGRGWMSGTQSQLNFLPERHSDFLYSVVGEEWGFLGSVLVVVLFAILIWRMLSIAQENSDLQGRLLATALASWIGYQAVVNMGMVMGALPVVGIPLPLMSYGGAAMGAGGGGLGLLQSVRRFGTRF